MFFWASIGSCPVTLDSCRALWRHVATLPYWSLPKGKKLPSPVAGVNKCVSGSTKHRLWRHAPRPPLRPLASHQPSGATELGRLSNGVFVGSFRFFSLMVNLMDDYGEFPPQTHNHITPISSSRILVILSIIRWRMAGEFISPINSFRNDTDRK